MRVATCESIRSIPHTSVMSKPVQLEALEKGEAKMITGSTDLNTNGEEEDEHVAVAIPLGCAPSDDDNSNARKKPDQIITVPKPPPSSKFRFDGSRPDFQRTLLAVVCSGTILLGCAVIGTLVAKGVQYYRVLNLQDDWS